jgi:hypothetical protein
LYFAGSGLAYQTSLLGMTWEIALVFILLAGVLACFVWEKFPPDVTALALFVMLIATGVLAPNTAFSVFSNPAPR